MSEQEKRWLLGAIFVYCLMFGLAGVVACAASNDNEPVTPGTPVVKSSADQTISPAAAPPGPPPFPQPTVSGYPIERWEKLREAKR